MTEKEVLNLQEELEYFKAKCASLEEGYLKLQKLNDENKQLKQQLADRIKYTHKLEVELRKLGR